MDVISQMDTGSGFVNVHKLGLDEMWNNNDNPNGHMFDDDTKPRIFVMATRRRVIKPSGKGLSNSETAGGSSFAYNPYVNQITAELKTIFGNNVDLSTDQYSPMTNAPDVVCNSDDTPYMTLKPDAEGETHLVPVDDYGDSAFLTHRGKLLVQYQPV
jgi:hypothetical protein